ncbi:MAG: hypothetical protein JKY65_19750 [Planctomycetes bacterium]|nr:hypothetical protein [Planctomycetota bacterium]
MTTRTPLLLLGALLALATTASAQDLDWKKLVEAGRYSEVGDKIEPYLAFDKSDAKLRSYLRMQIDYLKRGARAKVAGSEIILVRGAKNDRLFQMPNDLGRKRKDGHSKMWTDTYPSGGPRLMLPNRIRHLRSKWDKRLPYYDKYFREATDLMGGDGETLRELDKIIAHHKGGGLGTSANSVKSVLISASTRPLYAFGPPYYIIKIAPERCIFNYNGLSGEYEVLIPFFILPHEIQARAESFDDVLNHPLYKQSQLKDVPFRGSDWSAPSNWAKMEANVRAGRTPLPLDAPVNDGSITGQVERTGSRVYLKVDGKRLRVTPSATARELRPLARSGLDVRVMGEITGDTIKIDEVLSPEYKTMSATLSGDELVISGQSLAVHGPFTRGLSSIKGTVSLEGFLFADTDGTPFAVFPRRMKATLATQVTLRRPLRRDFPAGTEVTLSYVSSSGRSAIVRAADGSYGYVRMTTLNLGNQGLVGALSGQ